MGARTWRTRPSTRSIWIRARWWRSRCRARTRGDTTTLDQTLCEAGMAVAEQIGREAELRPGDKPQVNVNGIEELVADKGYHSGAVVKRVKSYEVRSYIPEKQQMGQRNWAG